MNNPVTTNISATTQIGRFASVGAMPPQYDLLSEDDFSHFVESVGLGDLASDYRAGFALISNGELLELWGFRGIVPYIDKRVTLLFSDAINPEINHLFWAIGELMKTRRYPRQRRTFERRVFAWISDNRPNKALSPGDIVRYGAIAAYNFGWLCKPALELYGVDPDSLWLTR